MKLIKILFLFLILNLTLFANTSEVKKSYRWSFGISEKSSMLTKFKDANIALQAWFEDMGEIYDVDIDVKFYENTEILYKDLKEKKIDVVVLDIPFFFKYQKDIEKYVSGKWSLSIDNEKFSQYYLLSNKSKSLKGFSDLRNKTLSIKKDDEISKYWLNKNSYRENKKDAKTLLKKLNEEKNDRRVLLNVFFGKVDYAIITKKAWEDMLLFNPAIKKRVEVLSKSKKIFIPFIGMHAKDADEYTKKLFYEVSTDLRNLKGGEKIIDILKFNSVYKLDKSSLDELSKYFEEYFILEKKHK